MSNNLAEVPQFVAGSLILAGLMEQRYRVEIRVFATAHLGWNCQFLLNNIELTDCTL